jgi:hypothetical protein
MARKWAKQPLEEEEEQIICIYWYDFLQKF